MSPTSTFMSGFSTGLYYFEISNHQQCDHKSRRLHLALLRVYCRAPSSKYCDASRVATYIIFSENVKTFRVGRIVKYFAAYDDPATFSHEWASNS